MFSLKHQRGGGGSLFGLYGDVPPSDRVWLFGFVVLNGSQFDLPPSLQKVSLL